MKQITLAPKAGLTEPLIHHQTLSQKKVNTKGLVLALAIIINVPATEWESEKSNKKAYRQKFLNLYKLRINQSINQSNITDPKLHLEINHLSERLVCDYDLPCVEA